MDKALPSVEQSVEWLQELQKQLPVYPAINERWGEIVADAFTWDHRKELEQASFVMNAISIVLAVRAEMLLEGMEKLKRKSLH